MVQGYIDSRELDNPIMFKKCPICNCDIYLNKHWTNWGCVNKGCALYKGGYNS